MESRIQKLRDELKRKQLSRENDTSKYAKPTIEITSTDSINNLIVETNDKNHLALLSVHSSPASTIGTGSPFLSYYDEYENQETNAAVTTTRSLNSRSLLSPIYGQDGFYKSMASLSGDEDPWRASSIGIKCVSYKPVGYIFLSRRILDLYATDGQHKIEILYNYSKKFRNKIKTPSIGSSMQNCSFCDTVTLDFDPESTTFDLVMEVQIITQGATVERQMLLSNDGCTSSVYVNPNDEGMMRKRKKVKKKRTSPKYVSDTTSTRPSVLVSSNSTDEVTTTASSSSSDDDNTLVISSYDLKVHKSSPPREDFGSFLANNTEINSQDEINIRSLCETTSTTKSGQTRSALSDSMQKIVIKTVIKSAGNSQTNLENTSSSPMASSPYSSAASPRRPDFLYPNSAQFDKNLRSLSSSSIYSGRLNDSWTGSSSSSASYTRRAMTPDKGGFMGGQHITSNSVMSSRSASSQGSKRSITTTVEFFPPVPNIIEPFDIDNEEEEKKSFFENFERNLERLRENEQLRREQTSSFTINSISPSHHNHSKATAKTPESLLKCAATATAGNNSSNSSGVLSDDELINKCLNDILVENRNKNNDLFIDENAKVNQIKINPAPFNRNELFIAEENDLIIREDLASNNKRSSQNNTNYPDNELKIVESKTFITDAKILSRSRENVIQADAEAKKSYISAEYTTNANQSHLVESSSVNRLKMSQQPSDQKTSSLATSQATDSGLATKPTNLSYPNLSELDDLVYEDTQSLQQDAKPREKVHPVSCGNSEEVASNQNPLKINAFSQIVQAVSSDDVRSDVDLDISNKLNNSDDLSRLEKSQTERSNEKTDKDDETSKVTTVDTDKRPDTVLELKLERAEEQKELATIYETVQDLESQLNELVTIHPVEVKESNEATNVADKAALLAVVNLAHHQQGIMNEIAEILEELNTDFESMLETAPIIEHLDDSLLETSATVTSSELLQSVAHESVSDVSEHTCQPLEQEILEGRVESIAVTEHLDDITLENSPSLTKADVKQSIASETVSLLNEHTVDLLPSESVSQEIAESSHQAADKLDQEVSTTSLDITEAPFDEIKITTQSAYIQDALIDSVSQLESASSVVDSELDLSQLTATKDLELQLNNQDDVAQELAEIKKDTVEAQSTKDDEFESNAKGTAYTPEETVERDIETVLDSLVDKPNQSLERPNEQIDTQIVQKADESNISSQLELPTTGSAVSAPGQHTVSQTDDSLASDQSNQAFDIDKTSSTVDIEREPELIHSSPPQSDDSKLKEDALDDVPTNQKVVETQSTTVEAKTSHQSVDTDSTTSYGIVEDDQKLNSSLLQTQDSSVDHTTDEIAQIDILSRQDNVLTEATETSLTDHSKLESSVDLDNQVGQIEEEINKRVAEEIVIQQADTNKLECEPEESAELKIVPSYESSAEVSTEPDDHSSPHSDKNVTSLIPEIKLRLATGLQSEQVDSVSETALHLEPTVDPSHNCETFEHYEIMQNARIDPKSILLDSANLVVDDQFDSSQLPHLKVNKDLEFQSNTRSDVTQEAYKTSLVADRAVKNVEREQEPFDSFSGQVEPSFDRQSPVQEPKGINMRIADDIVLHLAETNKLGEETLFNSDSENQLTTLPKQSETIVDDSRDKQEEFIHPNVSDDNRLAEAEIEQPTKENLGGVEQDTETVKLRQVDEIVLQKADTTYLIKPALIETVPTDGSTELITTGEIEESVKEDSETRNLIELSSQDESREVEHSIQQDSTSLPSIIKPNILDDSDPNFLLRRAEDLVLENAQIESPYHESLLEVSSERKDKHGSDIEISQQHEESIKADKSYEVAGISESDKSDMVQEKSGQVDNVDLNIDQQKNTQQIITESINQISDTQICTNQLGVVDNQQTKLRKAEQECIHLVDTRDLTGEEDGVSKAKKSSETQLVHEIEHESVLKASQEVEHELVKDNIQATLNRETDSLETGPILEESTELKIVPSYESSAEVSTEPDDHSSPHSDKNVTSLIPEIKLRLATGLKSELVDPISETALDLEPTVDPSHTCETFEHYESHDHVDRATVGQPDVFYNLARETESVLPPTVTCDELETSIDADKLAEKVETSDYVVEKVDERVCINVPVRIEHHELAKIEKQTVQSINPRDLVEEMEEKSIEADQLDLHPDAEIPSDLDSSFDVSISKGDEFAHEVVDEEIHSLSKPDLTNDSLDSNQEEVKYTQECRANIKSAELGYTEQPKIEEQLVQSTSQNYQLDEIKDIEKSSNQLTMGATVESLVGKSVPEIEEEKSTQADQFDLHPDVEGSSDLDSSFDVSISKGEHSVTIDDTKAQDAEDNVYANEESQKIPTDPPLDHKNVRDEKEASYVATVVPSAYVEQPLIGTNDVDSFSMPDPSINSFDSSREDIQGIVDNLSIVDKIEQVNKSSIAEHNDVELPLVSNISAGAVDDGKVAGCVNIQSGIDPESAIGLVSSDIKLDKKAILEQVAESHTFSSSGDQLYSNTVESETVSEKNVIDIADEHQSPGDQVQPFINYPIQPTSQVVRDSSDQTDRIDELTELLNLYQNTIGQENTLNKEDESLVDPDNLVTSNVFELVNTEKESNEALETSIDVSDQELVDQVKQEPIHSLDQRLKFPELFDRSDLMSSGIGTSDLFQSNEFSSELDDDVKLEQSRLVGQLKSDQDKHDGLADSLFSSVASIVDDQKTIEGEINKLLSELSQETVVEQNTTQTGDELSKDDESHSIEIMPEDPGSVIIEKGVRSDDQTVKAISNDDLRENQSEQSGPTVNLEDPKVESERIKADEASSQDNSSIESQYGSNRHEKTEISTGEVKLDDIVQREASLPVPEEINTVASDLMLQTKQDEQNQLEINRQNEDIVEQEESFSQSIPVLETGTVLSVGDVASQVENVKPDMTEIQSSDQQQYSDQTLLDHVGLDSSQESFNIKGSEDNEIIGSQPAVLDEESIVTSKGKNESEHGEFKEQNAGVEIQSQELHAEESPDENVSASANQAARRDIEYNEQKIESSTAQQELNNNFEDPAKSVESSVLDHDQLDSRTNEHVELLVSKTIDVEDKSFKPDELTGQLGELVSQESVESIVNKIDNQQSDREIALSNDDVNQNIDDHSKEEQDISGIESLSSHAVDDDQNKIEIVGEQSIEADKLDLLPDVENSSDLDSSFEVSISKGDGSNMKEDITLQTPEQGLMDEITEILEELNAESELMLETAPIKEHLEDSLLETSATVTSSELLQSVAHESVSDVSEHTCQPLEQEILEGRVESIAVTEHLEDITLEHSPSLTKADVKQSIATETVSLLNEHMVDLLPSESVSQEIAESSHQAADKLDQEVSTTSLDITEAPFDEIKITTQSAYIQDALIDSVSQLESASSVVDSELDLSQLTATKDLELQLNSQDDVAQELAEIKKDTVEAQSTKDDEFESKAKGAADTQTPEETVERDIETVLDSLVDDKPNQSLERQNEQIDTQIVQKADESNISSQLELPTTGSAVSAPGQHTVFKTDDSLASDQSNQAFDIDKTSSTVDIEREPELIHSSPPQSDDSKLKEDALDDVPTNQKVVETQSTTVEAKTSHQSVDTDSTDSFGIVEDDQKLNSSLLQTPGSSVDHTTDEIAQIDILSRQDNVLTEATETSKADHSKLNSSVDLDNQVGQIEEEINKRVAEEIVIQQADTNKLECEQEGLFDVTGDGQVEEYLEQLEREVGDQSNMPQFIKEAEMIPPLNEFNQKEESSIQKSSEEQLLSEGEKLKLQLNNETVCFENAPLIEESAELNILPPSESSAEVSTEPDDHSSPHSDKNVTSLIPEIKLRLATGLQSELVDPIPETALDLEPTVDPSHNCETFEHYESLDHVDRATVGQPDVFYNLARETESVLPPTVTCDELETSIDADKVAKKVETSDYVGEKVDERVCINAPVRIEHHELAQIEEQLVQSTDQNNQLNEIKDFEISTNQLTVGATVESLVDQSVPKIEEQKSTQAVKVDLNLDEEGSSDLDSSFDISISKGEDSVKAQDAEDIEKDLLSKPSGLDDTVELNQDIKEIEESLAKIADSIKQIDPKLDEPLLTDELTLQKPQQEGSLLIDKEDAITTPEAAKIENVLDFSIIDLRLNKSSQLATRPPLLDRGDPSLVVTDDSSSSTDEEKIQTSGESGARSMRSYMIGCLSYLLYHFQQRDRDTIQDIDLPNELFDDPTSKYQLYIRRDQQDKAGGDQDVNFIDRARFLLIIRDSDKFLYGDLLNQNDDCTYFPIYKFNDKKIEYDLVPIEKLSREIKAENSDLVPANFDLYTEWDSEYIKDYQAREPNMSEFDPYSAEFPVIESEPELEKVTAVENVQQSLIYDKLTSLLHSLPATRRQELIESVSDKDVESLDINLLDKHDYTYKHGDLAKERFDQVLTPNQDCNYFPIYSINKELVSYEPIPEEVKLNRDRQLNSPSVLANFEPYTEWNPNYITSYQADKPEENYKLVFQPQPFKRLAKLLEKRQVDEKQPEQLKSSSLPDSDLDLLDRSKFVLKIKDENDLYSNLAKKNNDPSYFPLYSLNPNRVEREPVPESELKKRQVVNSSSIPANFDLYNEWDPIYITKYQPDQAASTESFEKRLPISELIFKLKDKVSKSSISPRIADAEPVQLELESEDSDLNLLDKSIFSLSLEHPDDTNYGDVAIPNSDVGYFPIYKLNNKLVSYKPIPPEVLKQRELKSSSANEIFDSYSEWSDDYTSNYIYESPNFEVFDVNNANFEPVASKADLEPAVVIPSSSVWDNLTSRIENLTARKSEPYHQPSDSEDQPEIDLNVLDKSKYAIVDKDLDEYSFSDLVKPNTDVAYFPIYNLNRKLINYQAVDIKLKSAKSLVENFDPYSEWDTTYTTGYPKTSLVMEAFDPNNATFDTIASDEPDLALPTPKKQFEFPIKPFIRRQLEPEDLITEIDLNLLDKSIYDLITPDIDQNSFSSLLKSNKDVTYFPSYKLNKTLVSATPVSAQTLHGRQLKLSPHIVEGFDPYREWDKDYTSNYLSEAVMSDQARFDPYSQDFDKLVPEEPVQEAVDQTKPSLMNYFKKQRQTKTEASPPDNLPVPEEPKIDINLLDKSMYSLEHENMDDMRFEAVLEPNTDAAYFPLYRLNKQLVDYRPITADLLEKRRVKCSSGILEHFDPVNEWDLEYTKPIKSSKSSDAADFAQTEESSRPEYWPVRRSLLKDVFGRLRSSRARESVDTKADSQDDSLNDELDQNLLDKSKYSLVLSKDTERYADLVTKNHDPTYFPINKFNKSFVSHEPISVDVLRSRMIKNSSPDTANFDPYSDWDERYTSNYVKSLDNSNIVEDLVEIVVEPSVEVIEVKSEQKALEPPKESKDTQKDNDLIDSVLEDKLDMNLLDKSEYELVKPEDIDQIDYQKLLIKNNDVCYFPQFKLNPSLVGYKPVSEVERAVRAQIKHSPNILAVFDLYTDWDNSYTSRSHQTEAARPDDSKNRLLMVDLAKFIQNAFKKQPREYEPSVDDSSVDINILDKSIYELEYANLDNVPYNQLIQTDLDGNYFPGFKLNQKLITYKPISEDTVKQRTLKVPPSVSESFNPYVEWDTEYTSRFHEAKNRLDGNDHISTGVHVSDLVRGFIQKLKPVKSTKSISDEPVDIQAIEEIDINLIDKSRFYLQVPDVKPGDLLALNNDPAYFPSYLINKNIVEIKPVTQEIIQQRSVQNASSSSENFDRQSRWDLSYTSEYSREVKNPHQAVFDPYSDDYDIKKRQSVTKSLLDLFAKSKRTHDYDEPVEGDSVDINLLDKSLYEHVYDNKNLSEQDFDYVMKRNNESTYFPLVKLNNRLIKYDRVSKEALRAREIKNKTSSVENFDKHAEWDTSYTNGLTTSYKQPSMETFDSLNANFDTKKEEEMVSSKPSSDVPSRSIFKFISSLFYRASEESNEKKLEDFGSTETIRERSSSTLNKLIEKFNVAELADVNTVFQEAFYRASITTGTESTPAPPPSAAELNSVTAPASPIEHGFHYFDILRFQNLQNTKPVFDDFACFMEKQYEYSRYQLLVNSKRFSYMNQAKRSGKAFFFVHDFHNIVEDKPPTGTLVDFKELLGYLLISSGAASLFAYTFISRN